MPRTYIRITDRASWTTHDLQNAITAVRNGSSIRKSVMQYGIPEATLRRKIKLNDDIKESNLGRPPVFSEEQECELANHVLKLANLFYGMTPYDLRKVAYNYAEANNIPNDFNKQKKLAGKDWYYLFLKRHPEISLRKPEGTSINRITAFNEESLKLYFDNLENVFEKYKFKENKVFNVDESRITTVQKPPKQLGPKGAKQFGSRISWERGKNVTTICAFSASGTYVPPMFIFPRKRMTNMLCKNGPVGAIYRCSHHGWSNEDLFFDWIKHFKDFVKPTKEDPVLIILDNHSSHISLQVFEFCKLNGIIMLTIPPHTSHKLQPLDLTFFGPLKSALNRESDLYIKSGQNIKITPYELAEIFNKAYVKVATMEKAQSGFRAAGIFPLNREKFSFEEMGSYESQPTKTAVLNLGLDDEENDLLTTSISEDREQPSTSHIIQISTPSTSKPSSVVSVEQVSPIPCGSTTSNTKPGNRNSKRQKQQSSILTATPNKETLKMKEEKRKVREKSVAKSGKQHNTTKQKSKPTSSKPKKLKRKLNFSSSESESEVDLAELCVDDELDDMENESNEEACLVCGEFGKDREMWYRCVSCSSWSHEECSGWDSPENYLCDACLR